MNLGLATIKFACFFRVNIFVLNGYVFSFACDVADAHGGHHTVSGEFAHDSRWLVALLLLRQCVTVQCAHALHFAAIDGLLVEFLAQFEGDDGVLEGRLGVELELVTFLGQVDCWADGVANFTRDEIDA